MLGQLAVAAYAVVAAVKPVIDEACKEVGRTSGDVARSGQRNQQGENVHRQDRGER